MDPSYPAVPARRRRRWPWALLVTLVVLVGLLVAADRVALGFAEDKAAAALQSSQHLQQPPDVSVLGFPFLTQLAAGEFGEVTVTADDIGVGTDRSLTLQKVVVDMHHVTVSDNYRSVHAATATADATVSYAELSRVLGTPISNGGNGRLEARPSVQLLGNTFHGTVSAVVHVSSARGITFGDPKVDVAGVSVPSVVVDSLAKVFRVTIPLSGLPFGVRVTGLSVVSAGVVLKLAGSDLTYRRG
ncbi:MAG: LmeA family phospholipid-binding protein [Jatrophihabitantaceae bacterium]